MMQASSPVNSPRVTAERISQLYAPLKFVPTAEMFPDTLEMKLITGLATNALSAYMQEPAFRDLIRFGNPKISEIRKLNPQVRCHKLHLFIHPSHQVFVYRKFRKIIPNDPKTYVSGSSKYITYVTRLSFKKVATSASASLVLENTEIAIKASSIIPDNQALTKEALLQQNFKGDEHFCQILDWECYDGTSGNIPVKNKFVMYLKRYDCNLFQFQKHVLEPLNYLDREVVLTSIYRELLEGLVILEAKKLLHNDLKLENLFFLNGKVCIGDFGLAGFSSSSNAGTPLYFSPERLALLERRVGLNPRESHSLAPASSKAPKGDIWAMGCTFHMLLHCQIPRWFFLCSAAYFLCRLLDHEDKFEIDPNSFSEIKDPISSFVEEALLLKSKILTILKQLDPTVLASLGTQETSTDELIYDKFVPDIKRLTLLMSLCKKNDDLTPDMRLSIQKTGIDIYLPLKSLLEDIWKELEKRPAFHSLYEELIWWMLQPDVKNRLSASKALTVLNAIARQGNNVLIKPPTPPPILPLVPTFTAKSIPFPKVFQPFNFNAIQFLFNNMHISQSKKKLME